MGTRFVPLELGLIDEGGFVIQINDSLKDLQKEMVEHAKKHGEKAKGAKGKIVAEIILCCEQPGDDTFSCISKVKATLPSAPPSASFVMGGLTQDEQPALFCRKTGTSDVPPEQGILCTKDGQTVGAGGEVIGDEGGGSKD